VRYVSSKGFVAGKMAEYVVSMIRKGDFDDARRRLGRTALDR
jgi:hypothetical protein